MDIENATTPIILDLLKSNRLDLGIVTLPVSDRELKTQVLFSEEMVVVVKKNSPLARKRQITAADIGKLPLVLYDRAARTRALVDEFLRDAGVTPEVVVELSSVEAMEMMVEAGFGAAIIPYSAVRALPYRDTLHPLRIRARLLIRKVGVAMSEFSRIPRVVDELLQFIRERFQAIDSTGI
jgi:DNA-binding transcriptional LysR family regulator